MSVSAKCSCWNDTDTKLREQGFMISKVCSALMMGLKRVMVKHYLPVQRIDGKRLKRSDPHGVTISFCPFCGRSINEHAEEVTPDGALRIQAERRRQIEVEKWTSGHDAQYPPGVLEVAAECYLWELRGRRIRGGMLKTPPPAWPWADEWWKPSEDEMRQLEKAGALCAAAIDLRVAKAKKEEVKSAA